MSRDDHADGFANPIDLRSANDSGPELTDRELIGIAIKQTGHAIEKLEVLSIQLSSHSDEDRDQHQATSEAIRAIQDDLKDARGELAQALQVATEAATQASRIATAYQADIAQRAGEGDRIKTLLMNEAIGAKREARASWVKITIAVIGVIATLGSTYLAGAKLSGQKSDPAARP